MLERVDFVLWTLALVLLIFLAVAAGADGVKVSAWIFWLAAAMAAVRVWQTVP